VGAPEIFLFDTTASRMTPDSIQPLTQQVLRVSFPPDPKVKRSFTSNPTYTFTVQHFDTSSFCLHHISIYMLAE
jgi:hypothetical protein